MKKAFTMAEAILVMVILGIIATIMISNMKPVEFRDKGLQVLAKKVLGQIDTATTQILFNNSANSTMNTLYKPSTTTQYSFEADLSNTRALYAKYLVATRKTPTSDWCTGGANLMLKDGTCLKFTAAANNSLIPGETAAVAQKTGEIGAIHFDINDNDEPNIYGKDRYILPISADGIAY